MSYIGINLFITFVENCSVHKMYSHVGIVVLIVSVTVFYDRNLKMTDLFGFFKCQRTFIKVIVVTSIL